MQRGRRRHSSALVSGRARVRASVLCKQRSRIVKTLQSGDFQEKRTNAINLTTQRALVTWKRLRYGEPANPVPEEDLIVVRVLYDPAVLRPQYVGGRFRLHDTLKPRRLSTDNCYVSKRLHKWETLLLKRLLHYPTCRVQLEVSAWSEVGRMLDLAQMTHLEVEVT